MSAIKNYSQKILILLLCICIALMPMVIPAQAHAIALEGAALAAAFGLSEAEFGALLTMLASGVEFTSAEAAAAAATAAVASTTALVPVGETALATVATEAATAAGVALGPVGWIAIGAVGAAVLTPTIVSLVSLWKDDSVLNPSAANIVDHNNANGVKFVPMISDDYVDVAACIPLRNYFLDPYGDWDYFATSYQDIYDHFATDYTPWKIFEIEYAASNSANISNASISGYFTNPNAYNCLNSAGEFTPPADIDGSLDFFWFNLVYKWTDSKGTHIAGPITEFRSANVYGKDPLAAEGPNRAWYYDPDIISTNLMGARSVRDDDPEDAAFIRDPLGFAGIGPYSLLYPYVSNTNVKLYLANPGTTHAYDWASNPENEYAPYGLDHVFGFIDNFITGLKNRNTKKNPQPGYADPVEGLDFSNTRPVQNTYVPIPSNIAEMDWDHLMDWYKNNRNNQELAPVPVSDVGNIPSGGVDLRRPEEEDPITAIIPDLPQLPDIDIPGVPESIVNPQYPVDPDVPVDLDPIRRILQGIEGAIGRLGELGERILEKIPIIPTPDDPDIEDPDVDVTDAADPVLDIFNEYNQFEGLFSHFLPPEVAAMLWTFTLVGIFIFIVRFLIDR